MRIRALRTRLALAITFGVVAIWLAASVIVNSILDKEINEVFDSSLEETAQRILPLALLDIIDRDEEGVRREVSDLRPHDELFTYVVRDQQNRVLVASHNANVDDFPPYEHSGFSQTDRHRIYYDTGLSGTISIAVAEPLDHRQEVARETQMALMAPLVLVIPLGLLAIILVVRSLILPVRRFGAELETRGAGDLSDLSSDDLPSELHPITDAINHVLGRLRRTLESERSFASNAAHELRTPVAAALAQTQRLIIETEDAVAQERGKGIEDSLRRLQRLSEKLMQLARAEGGRMHTHHPMDLAPVLAMIVEDCKRALGGCQIDLSLPDQGVMSDLDPDAFAILCRNLIENAVKHGPPNGTIRVMMSRGGTLRVANEGPVLPAETLSEVMTRFERGDTLTEGSGIGLSIVQAIAHGAGAKFRLLSPATGRADGVEAVFQLTTKPRRDRGNRAATET